MKAALFLDRDNTLIDVDGEVSGNLGDPAHVRLIQGVASAIASLRGLNFSIIVVTNQAGVAHGLFDEDAVDEVNQRINDLIRQTTGAYIDRFYYCPFDPEGSVEDYARDHSWRKPHPGMIQQAAEDLGIDLSKSWTVGSQMGDVVAGLRAGTRTILLTPGHGSVPPLLQEQAVRKMMEKEGLAEEALQELEDGEAHPERIGDVASFMPDFVAGSLIEAVRIVAQQRKPEQAAGDDESPLLDRPATGQGSANPANPSLHEPAPKHQPSAKHHSSGYEPKKKSTPFHPVGTPPPRDEAEGPSSESPASVKSRVEPVRRKAEPLSKGRSKMASERGDAADKHAEQPKNLLKAVTGTIEKSPAQASAPVSPSVSRGRAASRREASEAPERSASSPTAVPSQEERVETPQREAAPSASGATPRARTPEAEVTLREILSELRNQRGKVPEFSYLNVLAVALQLVAVVCLLAAFFMGQTNDTVFIKWMSGGILVQLAVIAALLFRRGD